MSVTIKDVAKKANVAPSTVSRVMSDSPSISEKTKRKVRKVMEEMGYHLNLNARTLVQKSTQTIGIVMKNSTSQSLLNPVFPEVLSGISAFCHKQGYSMLLTTGETEEDIFVDTVKMVQGKRVDGIIVLYSKKDDKVVPFLMTSGIPFAVIGKPVYESNKMMYVDNDNVQAAKDATDYVIKRGHQRIGFIGGDIRFEVTEARLNGYKEAVRDGNLEINEDYIKNFPYDRDLGSRAINELLNLAEPPTAIVVTDDLNALIILLALKERNIKVPDDISIVSFNNTIISSLSTPPLTSVDIQTFQLGYESARCLLEQIKEPETIKKSIIIPAIIVERESCKVYNMKKPQIN
ncbi:LacI family DNA-binding transcriptional regulator [Neobacillus niacini]|uniref:LacI family DNA-binding transcriptional regulator n=1 Tax=Neobacillus niacini TaxID=86668 RepID=UPI002FFF7DBC